MGCLLYTSSYAVMIVVRIICLIAGTSLLTYTTSPIVLTDVYKRQGHWQKEVSHGAGNCRGGRRCAPCEPRAARRGL